MAKVRLYSTQYCPFCIKAKMLLENKRADFDVIDLSEDHATRQKLMDQTGCQTVPMIFVGDEFIGGCNELYDLESKGLLDRMLQ